MNKHECIDIPDMILLLEMKDKRECIDIPDMIILLRMKDQSRNNRVSRRGLFSNLVSSICYFWFWLVLVAFPE